MEQSTHTRQALAGLAIASVLTVAGWALQERSKTPAENDHPRVMVVGLRGSSWETLLDLVNEGHMPMLASLIEERQRRRRHYLAGIRQSRGGFGLGRYGQVHQQARRAQLLRRGMVSREVRSGTYPGLGTAEP